MMMGKTVCITDPAAAEARNQQMLAARAAGQSPDGNVAFPPPTDGLILKGSAGAGAYFPQFIAEISARIDDALGAGPWLISAEPVSSDALQIPAFALDEPRLAPWRSALEAWLSANGADGVLVRPDRHVFGTGDVVPLLATWDAALAADGSDPDPGRK